MGGCALIVHLASFILTRRDSSRVASCDRASGVPGTQMVVARVRPSVAARTGRVPISIHRRPGRVDRASCRDKCPRAARRLVEQAQVAW